MKDAYIIDAIRTPIGSFGGTLAAVRTDDLAALVIKELVKRTPTLKMCFLAVQIRRVKTTEM